ncbi:MAG: S8 family serine peptidase [Calditrichota bacterium]
MYRNIIVLAFLLSWTAFAIGYPIATSPSIAYLLDSTPANSPLSAIVYLQERADIGSLDLWLSGRHATRAERHRMVIEELRRVAEQTQVGILAELEELRETGRVVGYAPYWITNCIVIRGLPSAIEQIARRSDVEWVDVNFSAQLIEPLPSDRHAGPNPLDLDHGIPRGIRAIRAPEVWYELGYTGAGRLVANLDTGVDGNHPALVSRWRGNFAPTDECWHDEVFQSSYPHDTHGHGTHVMGTMCGNSALSNDSVGVAPEALWIACSGIDQDASEEFNNDVLDAYQWFADPDGNANTIEDVPDVVENSWGVSGSFPGYADCFNLWNDAIINCEAAGVVVIFSAGNSGPNFRTCGSPGGVAIDSVTMFAIGAVDATNDTIPPYDIANFSSRGPTDCPPGTAIKPEVCAPGVDVYSSYPPNGYSFMNGTSMAGPHVSGMVALLRQACPDADVREIKSVIMRSAHDYGTTGEDNTYGFGFIDAYAAVQMLIANRGFVMGVVRDSLTQQPLGGVRVEAVPGGRGVNSRMDGTYFISLLGDTTWSLRFGLFGYLADTIGVNVTEGDTVFHDVGLMLAPGGTLHGIVRAGNNVPLEAAEVIFPGTPVLPIMTDSVGYFQSFLPGGTTYNIHIAYHDAVLDTAIAVTNDSISIMEAYLSSPRSNPAGPDGYGYRVYDRYDTGYAAEFDWLEISPVLGGAGAMIEMPDRDSSGYIAMPFPLRYYGQEYDSLTINENGWLVVGISHDHTYFNFPIPGLSGPSGMIAPLWDNLFDDANGEISYYYDASAGRLVIEYYNLGFGQLSPQRATFQVQIFDPQARITPTGDCEILFLYRRVDVPGLCTIGLENPAESIGLQLLYNGTYDSTSWLIGPGAALRLTTGTHEINAVPPSAAVTPQQFALGACYPNPFNATTVIPFTVPHSAFVSITVYDIMGRTVERLVNSEMNAGEYRISWNANARASGLYFFVMQTETGFRTATKAMLIK